MAPAHSPDPVVALIGLLFGAAAASGLRLYATVAILGYLGRTHVIALPAGLVGIEHSWVIVVAAALYFVEFCADKIPVIDSVWDVIHTFIRVPAAVLLSFAALAQLPESWRLIATLLCGGVALSVHGLKSSTRAAINISPEPMTNWIASFTEDGLTMVLLYFAVKHPTVAIIIGAVFLAAALLLAAWIVRTIRRFWHSWREKLAPARLAGQPGTPDAGGR